jgi:hypothetical protein
VISPSFGATINAMPLDAPRRELLFKEDPHAATFVCKHVWKEGAPILYVSHDADGDGQFLCGGTHADPADCLVIGLEHVVERDPSVNAVARMCTGHVGERDAPTTDWRIRDETLDRVRDVINEHGWWVGLFEGDGDQPAFAYTIGLHETFGHPEIIIFGLPLPAMHGVLNEYGALIRDGARFTDGASSDDVVESYTVRFRAVAARESYETYLGYGCRFYAPRSFGVLQCVWPDKAHKFPGEEGVESFILTAEPMLP